MIALAVILIVISGLAKAFMDLCKHGALDRWGPWWNEHDSWIYKYKDGDKDKGPRFFGSTTFLVFLTDGWHFFQMIVYNFLIVGVFLFAINFGSLWELAILAFIHKGVFQMTYKLLRY